MSPISQNIRKKNDLLRQQVPLVPMPNWFMMTSSVASLLEQQKFALFSKVASFNDFNEDNDPHGEHDFGTIFQDGEKYFWKIDYYEQAYVVYPLVEESEHIDLKNAVEEYEKLKERFPDFTLGLLHGRLSFFEKQEIMSAFLKGEVQILVSTTVIEVGVDVANANMMVVEHADRFGLSQLHQLRGRVGRGEHKSYCVLTLSNGFSEEALSRMSIMEQTNDGFKIAEADLEIRGPGEFLGTRQSGLPEFRVASLVRDGKALQQAKESALKVIKKDPHLSQPEHQLLRKKMQELSSRLLPG